MTRRKTSPTQLAEERLDLDSFLRVTVLHVLSQHKAPIETFAAFRTLVRLHAQVTADVSFPNTFVLETLTTIFTHELTLACVQNHVLFKIRGGRKCPVTVLALMLLTTWIGLETGVWIEARSVVVRIGLKTGVFWLHLQTILVWVECDFCNLLIAPMTY